MNSEERKKMCKIEAKYEKDKREIENSEKRVNEEFIEFQRETEQLMDKVFQFTKDDSWDKRCFYREMEESQLNMRNEVRKFNYILEEKSVKLNKNYRRECEKLANQDE